MRTFLAKQIAGYRAMLANTDELNRVAWGSYISIQGGIDPRSATRVLSVSQQRRE